MPRPGHPRRTKAPADADAQLAASVRAVGLIQLPVVRDAHGKLVAIAV